ncbi:MAG: DNA-directed RNA polymerase subunit alpha [Candidatus Campbellbacteria bacterium]|nr:DNA-directed RNA polymerase subunit alpha [Candidatus Campbellbacteria bacterium]
MDYTIHLPSQPKVITEKGHAGMYQIDGLYPGYGHTLGNSLRRIILSSIPGAAITAVKIDGVPHEFSTIDGVKEDVVNILLNLKQIRFEMITEEPQTVTLTAKGPAKITAKDITLPGQLTILNPDAYICEVTGKNSVSIEMTVEKGLGYVPKENLHRDRIEIGTIVLDAAFTPIRRATYEVENMRVGDRTDFNRIKMFIETDGTITPRAVLERSINTMIQQLRAIVGFQEENFEEEIVKESRAGEDAGETADHAGDAGDDTKEFLKTRIESLSLSTRTENALTSANIRTVGGLVRKKEADLLEVEGLGDKGLQEIRRALANYGIILRQ